MKIEIITKTDHIVVENPNTNVENAVIRVLDAIERYYGRR